MAEAAAHAAAIAQALKASGVIVRLEPSEFLKILSRQDEPLVVQAHGGFFRSSWQYLTSYRGLAFFTKSAEQLLLPGRAEVVVAGSIWIPG
jgi:hypothetical protein